MIMFDYSVSQVYLLTIEMKEFDAICRGNMAMRKENSRRRLAPLRTKAIDKAGLSVIKLAKGDLSLFHCEYPGESHRLSGSNLENTLLVDANPVDSKLLGLCVGRAGV